MHAHSWGYDHRAHATLIIAFVLAMLGHGSGASAAVPVEQIQRDSTAWSSTNHRAVAWNALGIPMAPAKSIRRQTKPSIACSDDAADRPTVTVRDPATPAGSPSISTATIEVLAVATLNVPEAQPVRTTSRLTVPPGAQWQSVLAGDSLTLTLETGSLRVDLYDGHARIARAIDVTHCMADRHLDELASGTETTLQTGDRLVVQGDGTFVVHGLGDMPAIATVAHVTTP